VAMAVTMATVSAAAIAQQLAHCTQGIQGAEHKESRLSARVEP